MSPADLLNFTKVQLRDGTTVKALVEPPEPGEPVSRLMAFQMLLGAVLILAEIQARGLAGGIKGLSARMDDLRCRMENAIEREGIKR